jgi:hypothetical protein
MAINMNLDAGILEQALNMEDRNQTWLFLGSMMRREEKTNKYSYFQTNTRRRESLWPTTTYCMRRRKESAYLL